MGSDGTAINSTFFKYGDIPPISTFENYGAPNKLDRLPANLDGDGNTDVVWLYRFH